MDLEKVKELRKNYYENCKLWLPSRPQWRFYIFKFDNKSVKRFHLKNKGELRELLVKYTPAKVYYSASAWVNCENVRGNKGNVTPIKVGRECYLIFDIDNDESLSEARKSCLKVIDRVGRPDYSIITSRGFHLCYMKRSDKEREEMIKAVEDIEDVDIKCSRNQHNVFSLPLTLKKGKVCKFLSWNDLNNKSIEEIERGREIYSHLDLDDTSKRKETSDEEKNTRSESNRSGTGLDGTVPTVTNVVKKGKKKIYIPILIYSKEFIKNKREEVGRLVRGYDLGEIYVFESEKYLAFISLKCMEKRRLEKLLNSSHSLTRREFKKFGKIHFEFYRFNPKATIQTRTNKFLRASKKHYEFVKKSGLKINQEVDEFVGHRELKVLEVMKE